MAIPTFEWEGGRIGGRTSTTVAGTIRTNSNGAHLYMHLFYDKDFTMPVSVSASAPLNAGNNYTNTCYVTGLLPGRKYYGYFRAAGVLNTLADSVIGTEKSYSIFSFRTAPAKLEKQRLAFMSCSVVWANTNKAYALCSKLRQLGIQQAFHLGDVYYSDSGRVQDVTNGPYNMGSYYQPTTDEEATLEAYRTNCIATFGELIVRGVTNEWTNFWLNTPGTWQLDDHDRGWNDMAGYPYWDASRIARASRARQVADELFYDQNAIYFQNDGRTWTHGTSLDSYYYVDIPGVRIIVLDCRTWRDPSDAVADTPSKTMLGAAQKARFLNAFDTNPHDKCIIASPVMFDGWHGRNFEFNDGWIGFSYERDQILDHIWASGKASKTLLISGDTHAGVVHRYHSPNESSVNVPIYEIMAGQIMVETDFDWTGGSIIGDASGRGGEVLTQRTHEPNCTLVDINSDGSITARFYELITGKICWSITI